MSKNKFIICNNDEIHISREGWNQVAMTTYREDYYEELTSVTWTKENSKKSDNSYLVNGKLGKLHRYIMKKWYGEDVLAEMDSRGWIVDHMNNNGMDCRISNLEFLAKSHNTAKGQTFDRESKESRFHIAVNIFKDFSTGYYQITIFFNDIVQMVDTKTNTKELVNALFLLYDIDYRIVINDAENILLRYNQYGSFDLEHLNFNDYKIERATLIKVTEQEADEIKNKGRVFVFRDDKPLLVLGNGVFIESKHYIKGWDKK